MKQYLIVTQALHLVILYRGIYIKEMNMRIWIVHQHAIPPIQMGPTRHYELAKKLIAEGHEVYILAGNYCHNDFHFMAEPYQVTKKIDYYGQVPFIWFKVLPYTRNSIRRLLSMLLFAQEIMFCKDLAYLPRPDVIIGSSPSPFAAYAAAHIAKKFQIPFVYEIRDLWPETLLTLGKFSRAHPLVLLLKKIEDHLLNKATKIISVLPGLKEYLTPRQSLIEKIIWIPNFCNVEQCPISVNKEDDHIKIIYAGSFNVANDLDTLLSAAKILDTHHPGRFQIKMIGEGPQKKYLEKRVVSERISNIIFLPMVAKEKVHSLIAEGDILVGMVKKSNLYRYGTSLNKITDYLALGKPIVFAIDSPYSPICEAKAGITIKPEDPEAMVQAIVTIANLPADRKQQLGRNGRSYATENYNIENLSKKLLEHISNFR